MEPEAVYILCIYFIMSLVAPQKIASEVTSLPIIYYLPSPFVDRSRKVGRIYFRTTGGWSRHSPVQIKIF